MKTKGQLEYLKIRIFTNIEDDIETKYGLFSQGYDNGYMQCQEDMADKKYTEEDMIKAFKFYAYSHISQQPHSYEKLEQDYLKFINSLNKQD